MMAIWKGKHQVCGTCKFWCGERKIDFQTHSVETNKRIGRCAGWNSVYRGSETKEDAVCNAWEPLES
ncbi:MAG: hypothetical protein ACRCTE_06440 [Cellulosilyticaceae bacterium]